MKNILFIASALIILQSCGNNQKADSGSKSEQNSQDGKTEISVSILPQKYFLEQITGDHFTINVMIPPGSSPATYEPTPAQLSSLSNSDLYLRIGYTGFELAWMEKLVSTNPEMKVIDLSRGIDLIMEDAQHGDGHHHEGHDHGGIDPHIWMSPENVKIISKNMLEALSQMYPELKQELEKNYVSFIEKVENVNLQIREILKGIDDINFFTYHPALSYYAKDYKLKQHPLELGGKTPSSAHLKRLVDIGKEKNIGVVFLQMQFDQHNAEVLAKEIGAEIVQINPLDPEWDKQMVHIANKLKENLQ